MSEENKKVLVFVGPPLAVASFLAAFWLGGHLFGPRASAGDGGLAGAALPAQAGGPVEATPAKPAPLPSEAARRASGPERLPLARAGETGEAKPPTPAVDLHKPKAQPEPAAVEPGKYPAIFIDKELATYKFGTVLEGDNVEHTFHFENRGDADLVIDKVKTSCGCTVASYTKEPLPPGGKGEIAVVFRTKAKRGNQKKTIFVYCNDPKQPQAKVYLEGKVQPVFWVEPKDRINLGEVERDQKIEDQKFRVVWLKSADVEVKDVLVKNDALQVTQEPFEDEEHRGIALTVRIPDVAALAKGGQLGRINETIEIQTTNKNFRRQFIFIQGMLKREVMVRPHALTFGIARPGRDAVRKLTVSASEKFSLDPPTVECPLDFVDFEVVPKTEHKEYEIVGTLHVDQVPVGKFFRDYMKIRTNSEDVPVLSVLVTGRVLGPGTAARTLPRRPGAKPPAKGAPPRRKPERKQDD